MKKAESRKKTILRRLVLIFLSLLLGINMYLLNAQNVTGNQMPMPFGIGSAVVQSGSMEPTYSIGDLLFVKAQPDYAVGDIVVYQYEGILVVHRIIATDGNTVTTQGDANNAPDEPFSVTHIKGVVVGRISGVGYAIDFMKTPLGIILIIGCAVMMIELSIRQDKRAEDEDEKALQIHRLQEEIAQVKQELSKTKNDTENKN